MSLYRYDKKLEIHALASMFFIGNAALVLLDNWFVFSTTMWGVSMIDISDITTVLLLRETEELNYLYKP